MQKEGYYDAKIVEYNIGPSLLQAHHCQYSQLSSAQFCSTSTRLTYDLQQHILVTLPHPQISC